MSTVSQNSQQYRFAERGQGDITADVVDDAALGTVLWIQTSTNGCYLRPSRINELADGLRSLAELGSLRAEILAEAIETARGEYLNDDTRTSEDEAYNQAVSDVVAAIGALLEGGQR